MGVSPVGQSIAEAAAAIVSSLESWSITAVCHQARAIPISFGIELIDAMDLDLSEVEQFVARDL